MSEINEIYLKDYQESHFLIKKIDLDIDIYEDKTFVVSELEVFRNPKIKTKEYLVLDGVDLTLLHIELNGIPLHDDHYELQPEKLIVKTHEDHFTLTTKVEIHPEKNFTLEGLYKSGDIFCTQNEAEGFRKITYYLDRPDVMAKFTTILRAQKSKYPVLLSNGNKIDVGELEDGRHFAKWEDPFLKPSYLYAAVAGDLAVVKDNFKTKSGRQVDLEIYVDKGNEDKCEHAMRSLINSMKWDEEKFGLEYDLDIYMIVAVDSFNMGAMENKGLNIFNSAYVLAKKETATDHDFQGIEAVIGHEYFHNWTGNRVTCRDWFQLTLKEGLTVFRDQEFSSDMLSRSVKRIEDIKTLRQHQFPEDAGPMSHPIKPKSYLEISNFYSATVYEKGAEVIRMIQTIIGRENFRKGMDLYFERHDGQAVTTEDFVAAMSDASRINLDQFKVWYDQNGTPVLDIVSSYNEKDQIFQFSIKQSAKLNNNKYEALHIPFKYGLISESGHDIVLPDNGFLQLHNTEETFEIKNIPSKPIPSWNRDFSAPVIVNYQYSNDDLTFLMAYDKDDFNRFDAAQKLYQKEILRLVEDLKNHRELKMSHKLQVAFERILNDHSLDHAFKSYILSLPTEDYINEQMPIHDYDNVSTAINFLRKTLANTFETSVQKLYQDLNHEQDFKLDSISMGKRAFKNTLLSYISASSGIKKNSILLEHFHNATNMTDELAAFQNIVFRLPDFKEQVIKSFYEKWKNETLVMQKWLGVQASCPGITIKELEALEASDVYDEKIPNNVRALMRNFIRNNPRAFNAADGAGYKFIADKIIHIDKYNPQLASGLARSLRHLKHLDEGRKLKLQEQLERLLKQKLSNDTFEVVRANLNHS